jgi:GTPase SAR1 family protein
MIDLFVQRICCELVDQTMQTLPTDVLEYIATYSDTKTLIALLCVCKEFGENNSLWKIIYERVEWRSWRIIAEKNIDLNQGYKNAIKSIHKYSSQTKILELGTPVAYTTVNVTVIVLGDANVGKSSVLLSYCTNTFHDAKQSPSPTQFNANVMLDNQVLYCYFVEVPSTLTVQDAFQEFDLAKKPNISFMIMYDSHKTLQSAVGNWAKQVYNMSPQYKCVLVRTKIDQEPVTQVEEDEYMLRYNSEEYEKSSYIESVSRDIHAYTPQSCSSLTQKGLRSSFDSTYVIALIPEKLEKRSKKCITS